MFTTILVGTDGSDSALKAVHAAADLAATSPGATLHIVTVQKPMAASAVASAELATAAPVGAEIEWEAETKGRLEADARRPGRTRRRRLAHRRDPRPLRAPAEVLCDMAAHLEADLIVVGNRGMQGGRRFLGSVPNTVSHHAPCSVLIVDTQSD